MSGINGDFTAMSLYTIPDVGEAKMAVSQVVLGVGHVKPDAVVSDLELEFVRMPIE
jgi:hypothetical protein